MIWTIFEFAIVLLGFTATAILFFRFPALPPAQQETEMFPAVSVIIPARNEEKNLPLLLEDLRKQTLRPFEIVCADDDSEDETAHIARDCGAAVLSLRDKPEGWTGKTWACQNGANAAKGELLLFLDADVRLGQNGIRRLLQAYKDSGCTISIQPYHKTEKTYEQVSLLFNLVQIAANGIALPKPHTIGLYGPVILISRADYRKAGGHESVRRSVVEDISFGQRLKKAGMQYMLFIGDEEVSFRMYGGGLCSLLQGWTKSMAAGASKTSLPVFLAVFFWITSLIGVPLHLVEAVLSANALWITVYSFLYLGWALILHALSKRIGRFQLWAIVLYPVVLLFLLSVFAVSMIRKVLGLHVTWKGRAIPPEDRSCV